MPGRSTCLPNGRAIDIYLGSVRFILPREVPARNPCSVAAECRPPIGRCRLAAVTVCRHHMVIFQPLHGFSNLLFRREGRHAPSSVCLLVLEHGLSGISDPPLWIFDQLGGLLAFSGLVRIFASCGEVEVDT